MAKGPFTRIKFCLGGKTLQTFLVIPDGKEGYFVKPTNAKAHVHSYRTHDPERIGSVVTDENHLSPSERRHVHRAEYTPEDLGSALLGLFAAEDSPPPRISPTSDLNEIEQWYKDRRREIVRPPEERTVYAIPFKPSAREFSKREYKIDLAQLYSDEALENALVPVREKDLRRKGYVLAFSEDESKLIVSLPGKIESDDRVLELDRGAVEKFGADLTGLSSVESYLKTLRQQGYGRVVKQIRKELLDFKNRSLACGQEQEK